ncbi:MAG: hypothetical protein ACHQ0Y_11565 [Thermodesulfovibrionales bacterium]
MNKKEKIIIGYFLLSCLGAFLIYPRPSEVLALFIIGNGILVVLLVAVPKLMKTYEFTEKKYSTKNLIGYSIPILIVIYAGCFLNVAIVSLYEKRIVWNILTTRRGKAYLAIDIGLLFLFLAYCGVFYLRHKRWPKINEI